MSRIRSYAASLLALAAMPVATLSAQAKPQIQVLQLQTPSGVRNLPAQPAAGILSVRFDGRLTPGRALYVRVFRDKFTDLTATYPAQTQDGKCVVYAHASRFRVTAGKDQQLRINDLLDFYTNATNVPNQTLTLVFEEGDDPDANGPLHLDKKAVSEYFANAVVMPLLMTEDIRTQWAALARQLDQTRQRELAAQSGGFGWFKPKPVQAATIPPPPVSTAIPLPDKIFVPPCQLIKPITYVPERAMASIGPAEQEALTPVAIRQSQPCG